MSPAKPKPRAFRPVFDGLESLCLLSGGVVHAMARPRARAVDLRPTAVGQEVLQEVAAASNGVQTSLDRLTANQKGRGPAKVQGQFTIIDPLTPKGPVPIVFKFNAPLEHPRPKKVQINLGKAAKLVTHPQRHQVQLLIVDFVNRHHDEIRSLLNQS